MSMGLELSSVLQSRATAIIENPHYSGPDLSHIAVIGLEGAFCTGKSTITDKLISMLADIGMSAGLIGTRTTRERRPNDPDNFITDVDPEELIASGERGELINLSQYKTGHLYATHSDSLQHDLNIGPLMPDSIQKFRDAGVGVIKAFYLTTTPEQWQQQLDLDGRLAQPDAIKRIEEAKYSLEFVMHKLANPGGIPITIIHNDGTRSVEELAGHILYATGYEEFHPYVKRFDNYKSIVQIMYNHAAMLEPEDKAA